MGSICSEMSRYSSAQAPLTEMYYWLWNWPGVVLVILCFTAGAAAYLQADRDRPELLRAVALLLFGCGALLLAARPLIGAFYFCDEYRVTQMIAAAYNNGIKIVVGTCFIGIPALLIGFTAALVISRLFAVLAMGGRSAGERTAHEQTPEAMRMERLIAGGILSASLASFAVSSLAAAGFSFALGFVSYFALGRLESIFCRGPQPGRALGLFAAISFSGAVLLGALLL